MPQDAYAIVLLRLPLVAVVLLVSLSAGLRFAGSLGVQAPWIAPDEMIYGLSGLTFWETGHLRLLGEPAPFYGLYPLLAGLPLAAFGRATGLLVLQALQAVLVSSTAAIAYALARPVIGTRWALAPALMTAALPQLAYSGLIMSENAYLPTVALALLTVTRALRAPSLRNQILAAAAIWLAIMMRLQGIVLLPALLASVLLMAWFSRDARVVRRWVPTFAAAGFLVALVVGIRLSVGSDVRLLGAYTVATGGYEPGAALRSIGWHFGDVFLLVIGAPLVSTLILGVRAAQGQERDVAARALLAVALGYSVFVVAEVGVFASEHVGRLAERDLTTVAPPLFVVFALWLSRGMPRPQPLTSIVALLAAAPAVLLPVPQLFVQAAFPDAFMTAPLLHLAGSLSLHTLELVWSVGVAAVVIATVVPHRAARTLAAVVVGALAATSAVAQREIQNRSRFDRADFFGASPPWWIDQVVDEPVAYLYDGHPLWNAVWQTAFWNGRVTTVVALPGRLPGPIPGRRISLNSDGGLRRPDGTPLRERLIVAPRNLILAGGRVREINQGIDEPGLVLWRLRGEPKLRMWITGLLPNRDIVADQPVSATLYACSPGRLNLSLERRWGGSAVKLSLNGFPLIAITVPSHALSRVSVPTPSDADGTGPCSLQISSNGVRLRDINFQSGRAASAVESILVRRVDGRIVRIRTSTPVDVPPQRGHRAGYCLHGEFLDLAYRQPEWDKRYAGAKPAIFVRGIGLTCTAPPGYTRQGFAPSTLGVPEGFYPYYAPPR
ncbi:MAG: hypothetical protein C4289_09305 [Chloroflexota bacterium]